MFKLSDISKYRSVLMGIAILEVVLAHFLFWAQMPSSFPLWVVKPLTGLVFTEGFLFLSGFGLYYSWRQNPDGSLFFKKRISRLFIPYFIILLPFSIFSLFCSDLSVTQIIARQLTLKYWIWGKDGMWYISVSLLLDALFPFLYGFIFKTNSRMLIRFFVVVAFFLLIPVLLCRYVPEYYKATSLGIPKMWIFVVGMISGYFAFDNKKVKHLGLIYLALFIGAIPANISQNELVKNIGDCLLRLVAIPLVCVCFNFIDRKATYLKAVLEWFGKYSLEIYILHLLIYEALMNTYYFFNIQEPVICYSRIVGVVSVVATMGSAKFIHEFILAKTKNFVK